MKKAIAAILAMCAAWASFGAPVRTAIGGRSEGDGKEPPQNLWVWPTEKRGLKDESKKRPQSVWTPEAEVWYTNISNNGYLNMGNVEQAGDFGDGFVTSKFSTGYSWGTFLELEPGHYIIKYWADSDLAVRLGFYREVEGGFLWNSSLLLSRSNGAGYFERTFTVPDDSVLTVVIPAAPTNYGTATVSDIEIYNLD